MSVDGVSFFINFQFALDIFSDLIERSFSPKKKVMSCLDSKISLNLAIHKMILLLVTSMRRTLF